NGASKVFTTDIRDASLELSKKFHADAVINVRKEDPVEKILELTNGKGVDVVFECAGGNPQQGLAGHTTLHQAFEMVRPGGKVVQVAALVGELKINSQILRTKGIKWISIGGHGNKTIQIGADWVANGRIDLKSLVSHEIEGLENLPKAFDITQNKEQYGATNPCQVIVF
ncbi:MAG: zinc-binding dehydrogenase, partial [Sphaerochaetaceae bacterium]